MIKVLHFFKTYYPDTFGGVEQIIYQLAEGCQQYGINSEVLSLSRRGSARNEPYAHHLTHRSKLNIEIASTGFSISVLKDFAELAKQADIINYHFPWPYMDLVHVLSRIKKPTILTYQSDVVRQKRLMHIYRPLMHHFLKAVDHIVASSPNYAATSPILEQYRDKVSIIPLCLNKEDYAIPSSELLEKYRLQFGERFFLFVGALRYYKGIKFLIEASRGHDFPIVIVGSGGIEAELKQQAKELNLKNIHFVGAVANEDKVALFQLCYAFVFPSHLRSEAFGLSLLEAAMYGKPMISCEIGTGTTYINIDQETGISVPPENPEAIRQAMSTLWDNPALARQMGEKAEERYWNVFSIDKMAKAYAELYQRLSPVPSI